MPSVGNTYRKSLLGQITLSSSQSRFPRLSVKRVWVVHGEKVWSCRTEPQAVRPSPSVLQLRLTHTPSIDELPSDAVVFVAARLFYRNRTYLIRTPEQTVQTVY
ncbi:MAG: hypothetical protein RML35_05080 [Chloroherpetonaceae bacterium]|nr:hypothetical protein [Chloroherpetonaceae bacterium]